MMARETRLCVVANTANMGNRCGRQAAKNKKYQTR